MTSTVEEAQSTCNGLHQLIRRLHGAAVDLDKGGESAYEILALLASTDACVNNLSSQLQTLDSVPAEDATVTLIKPVNNKTAERLVQSSTTESPPEELRVAAGG